MLFVRVYDCALCVRVRVEHPMRHVVCEHELAATARRLLQFQEPSTMCQSLITFCGCDKRSLAAILRTTFLRFGACWRLLALDDAYFSDVQPTRNRHAIADSLLLSRPLPARPGQGACRPIDMVLLLICGGLRVPVVVPVGRCAARNVPVLCLHGKRKLSTICARC
jgi:hypothetical protein